MNLNLEPFLSSANTLFKDFIGMIPNIVIAIVIIIVFFILAKLGKRLVKRILKQKRSNIGLVLGRLSQWLIMLLGIFIGLLVIFPSFKASDFIGGLGIGSVAIGFAFKDIFQNLLCGILILLNEPFRIGDQIKTDGGQHQGTIMRIETRATFIKTSNGKCVVIPNSKLYTDTVVVDTKYDLVRTKVAIGVDSDADVNKTIKFILNAIGQIKAVSPKGQSTARIDELGDFSTIFSVCWWVDITKHSLLEVKSDVLIAIQSELSSQGINMPFPTQTLHLIKDDK